MKAKEKISRQVWQEIIAVEAYVKFLSQCEKGLIQNANLEVKYTVEVLEKRMEDLDAFIYLVNTLNVSPEKIKVFHMFTSPRNINPKITQTVGGFTTDVERDSAMTKHSDYDIAFIRPNKYNSGTAQNILRRYELKNLNF